MEATLKPVSEPSESDLPPSTSVSVQSALSAPGASKHCSSSPVPWKKHKKQHPERACLPVQKRRNKRGDRVRPALGHSSTPGRVSAPSTPPREMSLVWDPPLTPRSHHSTSGLTVLLTIEAYQVARNLLSLPVHPALLGNLLSLASRTRRANGASGTFPTPGPPVPPRGKPYPILASHSLAHHQSPESWHRMEAEVGNAPPWLPTEE